MAHSSPAHPQGVWNSVDGFSMTDPVIHYVSSRKGSKRHRNGGTDKVSPPPIS